MNKTYNDERGSSTRVQLTGQPVGLSVLSSSAKRLSSSRELTLWSAEFAVKKEALRTTPMANVEKLHSRLLSSEFHRRVSHVTNSSGSRIVRSLCKTDCRRMSRGAMATE